MTSCLLCVELKAVRSNNLITTKAEAQSHAAQHIRQTKLFDEDCNSSDQMFEKCFPNFASIPLMKRKKTVKKEGRQSLLKLCHRLLDGRISITSPRVTCDKCGSEMDLFGKKSGRMMVDIAIKHASAHLRADLFECCKCGRHFGSKGAVISHLTKIHRIRGLSEYYADKSGEFVDEIATSIKQCFSEANGPSDKNQPKISLRSETGLRCKTKRSTLAFERQLLCYQLIRQLAGDDGKIQCRLCPKRINVKRGVYHVQGSMQHALVHMKKPLFRCRVCSSVHNSRRVMHLHLKSTHALSLANNYESLADGFHSQIMDTLRKCYGDKSDK